MTSYLTSIDIFSLSRTVFEIFNIKVFRVWPWPLTFRGHMGSKIFSPFESPCMTSYLTSVDIFSLSRTVFEKILVKIFRVKQNGGFWPFQGQGYWPIFFVSRKGSDSHQTASNDVLRVKIGSAVLAAPSSKSVKSLKKKKKKGRTLICWVCVSPSGKIFPKPNFSRLFRSMTLSIVPNIFSIGSLGCLWQGVKLRHFQCKPWVAITTVVLPYNCDNIYKLICRFCIFLINFASADGRWVPYADDRFISDDSEFCSLSRVMKLSPKPRLRFDFSIWLSACHQI